MDKAYPKYIRVDQSYHKVEFKHIDEYRQQERGFEELDVNPGAYWGSGVYEIKGDGSIGRCVASNWDSSCFHQRGDS